MVKGGTKIESLAQYSSDPTTVFPQWIQTADMIYSESVLLAKKGEAFLETSSNGFHIIQVVAKGKESVKIQIATIERHITSSEQTRSLVYQKANAFAASIKTVADFEQTIIDKSYTKRLANALTPTTNEIRGLDNARSLIRETFFAKEKNLILQRSNNSPLFELGENYVVALLTKRNEEGFTPLADIKPKIEAAVIKEKKAADYIAKIKGFLPSNNLEQLAEQVGGTIKDVPNLTFASFSVSGIGVEPKINGIAMVLEVDEISKPIEGNNGVYVIKVTQKHPFVEDEFTFTNEVASIRRQNQSRTNSEIQKMLKDNAKIVDNRLMYNR
jgi:peptidyl-prolyl cis-trans isomerase D